MQVLALRPGRLNDASWLLVLTSDGDYNSVVDYLAVIKVPPYKVFDEQNPLLIRSKKEDSTFLCLTCAGGNFLILDWATPPTSSRSSPDEMNRFDDVGTFY